jgi:hypothetical protein
LRGRAGKTGFTFKVDAGNKINCETQKAGP